MIKNKVNKNKKKMTKMFTTKEIINSIKAKQKSKKNIESNCNKNQVCVTL